MYVLNLKPGDKVLAETPSGEKVEILVGEKAGNQSRLSIKCHPDIKLSHIKKTTEPLK